MSWEKASRLEHDIAWIITQQEINGWKFDIQKAKDYVEFLTEERAKLYNDIRPYLKPEVSRTKAPCLKPFNKDGTRSKRVLDYWGEHSSLVSGPYSPVDIVDPDLGSRQKVIKQLSEYGWKPLSYTDKGSPQLTEESLESLDHPIGKQIARWYVLRHRQSQIEGWLKNVRPDGRISACAIPCGTPTGRMRHSVVVNVPKTNHSKDGSLLYYPDGDVIFGTEMRELFIAEDGYVLVGYDLKGLELRLLSHYMNDPEFTEILLTGDIHTYNQEAAGLPTRDNAKTFIYAFIYGAQDEKIGNIIGGSSKDGANIRKKFLGNMPKLKSLIDRVQVAAKKGYLKSLDGRKMPVRKEFAALNTLIQGAGAVVAKTLTVRIFDNLEKEGIGLDLVKKVGDFHDESQSEVKNDENILNLYQSILSKSVQEVNNIYSLRCPMDIDVKIGPNWAHTH